MKKNVSQVLLNYRVGLFHIILLNLYIYEYQRYLYSTATLMLPNF